jgi:hypothetical protein
LVFASAFTASTWLGNGPGIAQAEASAQAQIAREAAAKRLAATAKRSSSPMFTATSKDSAS